MSLLWLFRGVVATLVQRPQASTDPPIDDA